jgi:hypothetical protein
MSTHPMTEAIVLGAGTAGLRSAQTGVTGIEAVDRLIHPSSLLGPSRSHIVTSCSHGFPPRVRGVPASSGFPLLAPNSRASIDTISWHESAPGLRKGGDSNSRDGGCPPAGFQDRCIQPLCHPSQRD